VADTFPSFASNTAVLDGVKIHYLCGGSGPPVILVHGLGSSAAVEFYYNLESLAGEHQVFAVDLPGFGRSDKPALEYTIELFVRVLRDFMRSLGIAPAAVMGVSMGGRIALAMALDFPGRVRSLIMAASGSGPAARHGAGTVPGLGIGFISELAEKGFEKHIRDELLDSDTYLTDEYRASHPNEARAFYDMASSLYAKWPEFLRLVAARQNFEGTHRLGDLRMPVLIAVGDLDSGGSNHVYQAQQMKERIPSAELRILPGQSHGFFWQAPGETNDWIAEWVLGHAKGAVS